MAYYRCYFLDENELIIGVDKIYSQTDTEAIRAARDLAKSQAAHVRGWTLFNHDRCVMPATMLERRTGDATDAASAQINF